MKWAKDARNLVKNSDLETKSQAIVSVEGLLLHKPQFRADVSPLVQDIAIAKSLYERIHLSDRDLDRAVFRIERRWIDKDLPNTELLDALSYAFGRLAFMLHDAHIHLNIENEYEWTLNAIDSAAAPGERMKSLLRPRCMINLRDERVSWVKVRDGAKITLSRVQDTVNREDIEMMPDRYGIRNVKSQMFAPHLGIVDRVREMWPIAKRMTETDGYHITATFLWKNGHPVWQAVHAEFDHDSKAVVWAEIKQQIQVNGADQALFIGEVWVANPESGAPMVHAGDSPNRKEGLSIEGVDSSGSHVHLFGEFVREGEQVRVSEPTEMKFMRHVFADAAREAWGLPPLRHSSD